MTTRYNKMKRYLTIAFPLLALAIAFTVAPPIANATHVTCLGSPAQHDANPDDADTLTGTANADVLHGLAGNDTINGLGGDDKLCGGNDIDTINGGTGLDTIDGELHRDIIHGNEDRDDIRGDSGDDDLFGDAGQDVIDGGFGLDHIEEGTEGGSAHGQADTDTIYHNNTTTTDDNAADTIFCGGPLNDNFRIGTGDMVPNNDCENPI